MNRRDFLKTTTVLSAAGAVTGLPRLAYAAEAAADRWRIFEVTTRAEVFKPKGASRVWLPVPLTQDTPYQKDLGSVWSAEGGTPLATTDAKYGAGIVFAEFGAAADTPSLTVVSRFATRDRAVDLSQPANPALRMDRAARSFHTAGTEFIPVDGIVRTTARDIVKNTKGGDIERARAVYEWVVENTFRDPQTRGCGWGDIKTMLETGNFGGKCGDLNAMFVGLTRSLGIPARDVYGLRVAASARGYRSLGVGSSNVTRAQHCRAEFWADGYGWIPVDPADVRKVILEEEQPKLLTLEDERVKRARTTLFGAWEMNWLAYNYAHDLALPKSAFGRVPYFMYPTGETAEGRLDSLDPDTFKYTITAREVSVA